MQTSFFTRLAVPWMSGLVNGLQNRLRRFESARHLLEKSNPRQNSGGDYCFLLFLVIEDVLYLVDLVIIKPLGEFLASLFNDFRINARPHLLQHEEQHGKVVGESGNGNGIGNDIERTDHVAKGSDDDGLVALAHLIALQRVVENEGSLH